MELHQQFADGSLRPSWAGPVRIQSRKRNVRPERQLHSVELSGVVVPVQVHPRFLPAPGHQHTFGLGLGFPDLSKFFLNPSARQSKMSNSWAAMEGSIAAAAAQVMGWGGNVQPRQASRSQLPANALLLQLSSSILRERKDSDQDRILEPDSLSGRLTKVFPIRDVSGRMMRMQTGGASSRLRLTPFMKNWSRDPRSL